MKLVIIFGPHAVGKMTVGQDLEKKTGLKLFHNHMTIELVSNFFSYGSMQGKKLVRLFREEIFEEVSKSELPGIIFTYVWALNKKSDWDYLQDLSNKFKAKGAEVFWVELESDVEERLVRNKSENRLNHKPIKRNFEFSENDLKESFAKNRLNSDKNEIKEENYIRIDNTNLSSEEVSEMIIKRFNFNFK